MSEPPSDDHRTSCSPPPDAPTAGYGHYASYHALWHLRAIGVVPDLNTFDSAAWDAAEAEIAKTGRPTRVALIDVSVAFEHPNLRDTIATDLMIDFFSNRFGVLPRPNPATRRLRGALARREVVSTMLADERGRELLAGLCRRLEQADAETTDADAWRRPLRILPATSATFSAHGTAMAGLIGARPLGPAAVTLAATSHIGAAGEEPSPQPPGAVALPYVGIDPFCEIVPISTSFDPDPEQLLLAMLYAVLVESDVIVLARDFPDPVRTDLARSDFDDLDAPTPDETAAIVASYPVDISGETDLWDALRQLTLDVSRRIPIVCAAGNAGDDLMMYPGRLAREDNGVIAVGAMAASGLPAGYSSGAAAGGVTVYAPSGDGERLDIELQRLDTAVAGFRPEDHSASYLGRLGVQHVAVDIGDAKVVDHATGHGASVFATQEIISTDVPGFAGYNASAFALPATAGGLLDYRSYYCHFSGTSAATAIVAGVLSLGMAAGIIGRNDGVAAKRALQGRSPFADGAPVLMWPPRTDKGVDSNQDQSQL